MREGGSIPANGPGTHGEHRGRCGLMTRSGWLDGGFGGGLAAADLLEGAEEGVQGGVELVEGLEEGDADDAVGHDVTGEGLECVVHEFAHGLVFGLEGLERGVVRQILGEAGDVEVGGHAAGVRLDAGDGLLAEDARAVPHFHEGYALVLGEAHGAAAEGGADGLQGSVEGGDLGGSELDVC